MSDTPRLDRLDRIEIAIGHLQERHEALTQSVELLHADIQELKNAAHKDGENIHALAQIAAATLDSIKRLERIAAAHQQRLEDLEQR